MNAWQHLPNAHHIDWVLKSLKANPRKWTAALNEAWNEAWNAALNEAWNAARDAIWDAVLRSARDAACDAARDAARDAIWDAVLRSARDAACDAARDAAHGAILALIAYDDCDQYLSMTYDQLLAWAHLSERPQAVLLLPLKWIQENE